MTQTSRIIVVFLATVVTIVISACNTGAGSNVTASPTPLPLTASVIGSIAYPTKGAVLRAISRDAIGLPTDLGLEVYLVSISRAGTPSTIISKQEIKDIASGPQPFTIEYFQEDIDENERYAIQGQLMQEDKLIAMNTTVYPVLTYGKSDHVNLVLELIGPKSSRPSVPQRSGWLDVPAPVESVSVRETYTAYSIQITSYLPNGCFKFKGSEKERRTERLKDIWAIDPEESSASEIIDTILGINSDILDINLTVTNLKSALPV